MPIQSNVTFLYTKLNKPAKKYQSESTEYSVDACVSKADAKAWNKAFPKQKAKELDNAEFKKIFKINAVFAEQDEQFVIKFKRPAEYKDGNPIAEDLQPKVLVKQPNGKLKNVAKTTLVANGSKGVVEYDVVTNDFGTFARLKNIRVDDLIEYQSASSTSLGELEDDSEGTELSSSKVSSLGDIEEDVPVATKGVPKKARKVVEEEDEDAPF